MISERQDIHNSDIPLLCRSCEARHKGMCGALNAPELVELARHTHKSRHDEGSELIGDSTEIRSYANVMRGVVKLSPRYAVTLFLALSSNRPEINPRIFEDQMGSIEDRQGVWPAGRGEKLAVWPVLPQTVRERLIALGLAPERYARPQGKRSKPRCGQLIWDKATFNFARAAE